MLKHEFDLKVADLDTKRKNPIKNIRYSKKHRRIR